MVLRRLPRWKSGARTGSKQSSMTLTAFGPLQRPAFSEPQLEDAYMPQLKSAPREANVSRGARSEEHTSELQSPMYLVCRLLLEKKKKIIKYCLIYHKT